MDEKNLSEAEVHAMKRQFLMSRLRKIVDPENFSYDEIPKLQEEIDRFNEAHTTHFGMQFAVGIVDHETTTVTEPITTADPAPVATQFLSEADVPHRPNHLVPVRDNLGNPVHLSEAMSTGVNLVEAYQSARLEILGTRRKNVEAVRPDGA
jgi:hypothetical protein